MVPAMQFPSCENVSSGLTHILLVVTLGTEEGGRGEGGHRIP